MADLKRLFVSPDIAKRAFEAGFREECFAWYPYGDEQGISKLRLGMVRPFDGKFTDGPYDGSCQPFPMPGDPFYPAPLYQQLIDWLGEKMRLEDSVLRTIFLYSGTTLDRRLTNALNNLGN